jgi:hypothetical protein
MKTIKLSSVTFISPTSVGMCYTSENDSENDWKNVSESYLKSVLELTIEAFLTCESAEDQILNISVGISEEMQRSEKQWSSDEFRKLLRERNSVVFLSINNQKMRGFNWDRTTQQQKELESKVNDFDDTVIHLDRIGIENKSVTLYCIMDREIGDVTSIIRPNEKEFLLHMLSTDKYTRCITNSSLRTIGIRNNCTGLQFSKLDAETIARMRTPDTLDTETFYSTLEEGKRMARDLLWTKNDNRVRWEMRSMGIKHNMNKIGGIFYTDVVKKTKDEKGFQRIRQFLRGNAPVTSHRHLPLTESDLVSMDRLLFPK